MDEMVQKTQKFLNSMYGGNPLYNKVNEDGVTGWETIYALTRAFQIELGLTSTADSFGAATTKAFQTQFPQGIVQQEANATETSNIYAIIQGALWCKGYSTGASGITLHFYGGTGNAVKSLKSDMGISSADSTVTLNVMKSLLSMDQFKVLLLSGGTDRIRYIQRQINRKYEDLFGIIPCDGIYGRSMNLVLIKILQKISGVDTDGVIGRGTKAACPVLPDRKGVLSEEQEKEAIELLRYALNCNGFDIIYGELFQEWDETLTETIKAFQAEYALPVTGDGDLYTWMSLLLSKGDTDRPALACDASTQLNAATSAELQKKGYLYVGRYLTGTVGKNGTRVPKYLTREECEAVFEAGLNVFAIYQDNTPSVEYYDRYQGREDAYNAVRAAKKLGIPRNEVIYFAVDCDMQSSDIRNAAIPYFSAIAEVMETLGNYYRIGVYGSRNVCDKVSTTDSGGYACSSFVADASSGYSGNMGFRIPKNWAFDQFVELKGNSSSNAVSFDIDKVAYSGRYSGFHQLSVPVEDDAIKNELATAVAKKMLNIFNIYPPVTYAVGKGASFDVGVIKVAYSTAFNENIDPNENIDLGKDMVKLPSIFVSNGKMDSITLLNVKKEYESLAASLQIKVDSGGQLAFVNTVSEHIGNGTITIGYKLSASDFQLMYRIEQMIGKTETTEESVTATVTLSIRKEDLPNLPFYQEMEKLETLIQAAAVVFGVLAFCVLIFTIGAVLLEGGSAVELSVEAVMTVMEVINAMASPA